MTPRSAFLALATAQALHSIEEYAFRLWETFPPARALTSLVSDDLERGFIAINVSIVALAFASYWWPVRNRWASAVPVMWAWTTLELVNGIGHPMWSAVQGGYTPGLATSLVLLPLALTLARGLLRERDAAGPA